MRGLRGLMGCKRQGWLCEGMWNKKYCITTEVESCIRDDGVMTVRGG